MHDVMRGHQVGKRDGYNCNGKAPTKQSVPCNLSDQDLRYTNCFFSPLLTVPLLVAVMILMAIYNSVEAYLHGPYIGGGEHPHHLIYRVWGK